MNYKELQKGGTVTCCSNNFMSYIAYNSRVFRKHRNGVIDSVECSDYVESPDFGECFELCANDILLESNVQLQTKVDVQSSLPVA